MNAKPFLWLLALLYVITACDKSDDPISNASTRVVSSGSSSLFSEITVLLNLEDAAGNHILVPRIDSVQVIVDGKVWTASGTTELDTSLFSSTQVGDFHISERSIAHAASVTEFDLEGIDDFGTVGEFASLLNQDFDLEPGEYLCLLAYIEVTDASGQRRAYHPYSYKSFEVTEDKKSAYIGEITLTLDQ